MNDSSTTRVVCVGLGAIGQAALEECLRRDDIEVVGAVDPARGGEDFAGINVLGSIEELDEAIGDVAIVATGSDVGRVAADAARLTEFGLHVVSSCEGLVYPWLHHAGAATQLDEAARGNERVVVGTGVNPGFVMDALPVMALSVCISPRALTVSRNVDLDRRRPQLPAKLGVGATESDWHRQAEAGGLGHAGLEESAALCAIGAGWPVEDVRFERSPLGEDGRVVGIREVASVDAGEGRSVRLELVFRLGGEDVDRVDVEGEAGIAVTLQGVHGDRATVARLVQAATVVASVPAGLRLPIELPAWSGNPARVAARA